MSLDDEFKRLLSFHIESPQFLLYEELFTARLNKDLYDSIITTDEFNYYTDKLNDYRYSFGSVTEEGIPTVMNAYNKVSGESYILESCSAPMVKYIKFLSEKILKVLEQTNDARFNIEGRLEYLVSLLSKANSVCNNPNREVYYYLNRFRKCMIVTCRMHNFDANLKACYEIYFNLYKMVIEADYDFYKEYDRIKNGDLGSSSVFNSDNKLTYYDFLVLTNNYLKNLIIPDEQVKSYTKDEVMKIILNSNIPNGRKESYNATIVGIYDDLYYFKGTAYDVFSCYNSYGDEFVYYCDYNTCQEGKSFCNNVLAMCEPFELIKFCVYHADNIYMSRRNNAVVFNNVLLESLLALERSSLITNAVEVFEYFKKEVVE